MCLAQSPPPAYCCSRYLSTFRPQPSNKAKQVPRCVCQPFHRGDGMCVWIMSTRAHPACCTQYTAISARSTALKGRCRPVCRAVQVRQVTWKQLGSALRHVGDAWWEVKRCALSQRCWWGVLGDPNQSSFRHFTSLYKNTPSPHTQSASLPSLSCEATKWCSQLEYSLLDSYVVLAPLNQLPDTLIFQTDEFTEQKTK